MEAVQIKKAWKSVKLHIKAVWRGFCKVIYGTATAALVALAIFGFLSVTEEGGWSAVFDFIASCAILTIAIIMMYLFGCGRKKGAKHG